MMEIIRKREHLLSVGQRWVEQYPYDRYPSGSDKGDITDALNNMRVSEINQKAIDGIIGNNSWTKLECNECHKDNDFLAVFNDYSSVVQLCRDCLTKAADKMEF